MITKQPISSKIHMIENGNIADVKGFRTAGTHCGLKRKRPDLGIIVCDVPASAAGVFTLNKIQAAPLYVTKESLRRTNGKLQAVLVNSGNANACTGQKGYDDALEMRKLAAQKCNIPEQAVAVTSTGVIGEHLPMEKIRLGVEKLQITDEAKLFSKAILTTDTYTKEVCVELTINNKVVRIGGVAKGSGMIHPNMATMLGFITTDAVIEPDQLQGALSKVTDETFNRITVDGDTSTNDMVLVMASGLAGNDTLNPQHQEWSIFNEALTLCAKTLAKMIARDGEGATKLIEVQVTGAATNEEAGKIAKTIVGSDLVKTAAYGRDANWGRIICAIGYSDCVINPQTIDIAIGPYQTLIQSEPKEVNDDEISAYMDTADTIVIQVNLHCGSGTGEAWGCDLSYDYVRINAGYRT
ncbi:bifunctional ornithine acetyltransferase/N-acetylglutamate synthase [Shouchella patagoniensis]|uniref:bifunctional ornithine acetyltransferase/N-acetylglutamate synthase n=1 Tax=Shouchella patagoniensis TaxID=228576 RepID=UPI000994A0EA|nr:bifunctional ornithine acetyltransferase/N-acetylglutamate synthase [Shouchella patagoniensis]